MLRVGPDHTGTLSGPREGTLPAKNPWILFLRTPPPRPKYV